MRFVWFWTFWHWSRESHRDGSLLRTPLEGMASHWDEWYRHEASVDDLASIEALGGSESSQRQFVRWIMRHWFRETEWRYNRLVARFVLTQLALVPPFNGWRAFSRLAGSGGLGGVSAVVLAEGSEGSAGDVRQIEPFLLPAGTGSPIVADGFQAEPADLETPHQAAASLLSGKGFLCFLALWCFGGRRPYPIWLKGLLGLAWLAVGAMILRLLYGPEPGEGLRGTAQSLLLLWSGLLLAGLGQAAWQGVRGWLAGRRWSACLKDGQVRLRMAGGLTLKGGSAGLAYCLNVLLSLYRSRPQAARRAWLWQNIFRRLDCVSSSWAATGVVSATGWVRPVVLEPKLRACFRKEGVHGLFTPRQSGAAPRALDRVAESLNSRLKDGSPGTNEVTAPRLGFAADAHGLRVHRCLHAAQSLLVLGGLSSVWQCVVSLLAFVITTVMVMALPDLMRVLWPPPAPAVVGPSSSSPFYLWVNLDTRTPERFQVVLESGFWANRSVQVNRPSAANAPARAEIRLLRLPHPSQHEDDASIWVERRYRFLSREFALGERVGRYSLPYLANLGHE